MMRRIVLGAVSGCLAGASIFWIWTTRAWPLSFWTTLQASVNAAKYTHPVEHFAQGLVIGMLFFGVLGCLAGGLAGGLLRRRLL